MSGGGPCALSSRIFAFTVAASITDPLMTGLKRRPFCVIVLPRITKLLQRPRSRRSVVVAPPTTTSVFERLILRPERLALGKVTPGLLEPVSFVPLFSVTLDWLPPVYVLRALSPTP